MHPALQLEQFGTKNALLGEAGTERERARNRGQLWLAQ